MKNNFIKLLKKSILEEQKAIEEGKLGKTMAAATIGLGALAGGLKLGKDYLKIKPEIEKNINVGKKSMFSYLDISEKEGYSLYKQIAQEFINTRSPNLLRISGDMLAKAASNTYKKTGIYVPVELVLAQLAAEGGIGNSNKNSRPIKYNNPFNVSNTDEGKNKRYKNVQEAIDDYYNLMARKYLSSKSPDELLNTEFVNSRGERYASNPKYENLLKSIIDSIKRKITDKIKNK
jgi:hypothetical protein